MGLVTGGIFIVLGVFVLCVATFGIFRFEYALNRIHVAAKCDTLGSMLILAGLIISNGWNMESAKIGLILLFIWIGNPAASHMVARAEARSNPGCLNMKAVEIILLLFLMACSLSVFLCRNLLVAAILFMANSLIMSIIWVILQSPDLAITEAAVGAGVTGILLFITLYKVDGLRGEDSE